MMPWLPATACSQLADFTPAGRLISTAERLNHLQTWWLSWCCGWCAVVGVQRGGLCTQPWGTPVQSGGNPSSHFQKPQSYLSVNAIMKVTWFLWPSIFPSLLRLPQCWRDQLQTCGFSSLFCLFCVMLWLSHCTLLCVSVETSQWMDIIFLSVWNSFYSVLFSWILQDLVRLVAERQEGSAPLSPVQPESSGFDEQAISSCRNPADEKEKNMGVEPTKRGEVQILSAPPKPPMPIPESLTQVTPQLGQRWVLNYTQQINLSPVWFGLDQSGSVWISLEQSSWVIQADRKWFAECKNRNRSVEETGSRANEHITHTPSPHTPTLPVSAWYQVEEEEEVGVIKRRQQAVSWSFNRTVRFGLSEAECAAADR